VSCIRNTPTRINSISIRRHTAQTWYSNETILRPCSHEPVVSPARRNMGIVLIYSVLYYEWVGSVGNRVCGYYALNIRDVMHLCNNKFILEKYRHHCREESFSTPQSNAVVQQCTTHSTKCGRSTSVVRRVGDMLTSTSSDA